MPPGLLIMQTKLCKRKCLKGGTPPQTINLSESPAGDILLNHPPPPAQTVNYNDRLNMMNCHKNLALTSLPPFDHM